MYIYIYVYVFVCVSPFIFIPIIKLVTTAFINLLHHQLKAELTLRV